MRTILVTAYAINPYKGSEDGMGWNHILQIAKSSSVVAITRKNNIPAIQKYIIENQLQHLPVTFYGYDLPLWMRFWKRGENGAMAYFYLWQLCMPVYILFQGLKFDIAHNLNFHTDWIPTFLWVFRKPVVWGPVGHHPKVPSTYYHSGNSSKIDRIKNQVIWMVKKVFWNLDPFFYLAKWNVDKVLCFSEEVEKQMRLNASKAVQMYSVGSEPNDFVPVEKNKFSVLSVGRLVPLKGFDITVRSFHAFLNTLTEAQKTEVELVIIGKGKMTSYIQDYIKKHELESNIRLFGWMEREGLKVHYEESSVFLFPSHEGAGMVVPEAFSYGLPTICFDNCGPGTFVNPESGLKVSYTNYNQSITDFSNQLLTLYKDRTLLRQLSLGAKNQFDKEFVWDIKGERLADIYKSIGTVKVDGLRTSIA